MSSTDGSPTSIGWKRRSSAASFSMCLRYSSSVVAPTARSSPRASIGLSRLAASTAPSAAPAPTIVCSSSRNSTTWPPRVGDLLQDRLQALLELAAVLRAGQQRADVQRDHAAVAQRLGDVAVDDPLGEALDDRGLADAGLADQHRVVLRAAAEDLDHAADLVVAADDRVELAVARGLGEVAAELLQRLDLLLGRLVGDAVRAAHVGERLQQPLARGARGLQRVAGGAVVLGQREQQVLDGDVVVLEVLHLALGAAQQLHELRRGRGLGCAGQRRQLGERGVDVGAQRGGRDAELAEHRRDEALLLIEQGGEQVLGRDLRMAPRRGQGEGCLQGLLGLDRESVGVHGSKCSST